MLINTSTNCLFLYYLPCLLKSSVKQPVYTTVHLFLQTICVLTAIQTATAAAAACPSTYQLPESPRADVGRKNINWPATPLHQMTGKWSEVHRLYAVVKALLLAFHLYLYINCRICSQSTEITTWYLFKNIVQPRHTSLISISVSCVEKKNSSESINTLFLTSSNSRSTFALRCLSASLTLCACEPEPL